MKVTNWKSILIIMWTMGGRAIELNPGMGFTLQKLSRECNNNRLHVGYTSLPIFPKFHWISNTRHSQHQPMQIWLDHLACFVKAPSISFKFEISGILTSSHIM